MRSGCDITFIGGIIRYVLNDMQTLSPADRANKYNMTYLANYTNAALIINDDFEDAFDPSHPGTFVGFTENSDPAPSKLGSYSKANWGYANATEPNSEASVVDNTWTEWEDLDPKCVLRLLWDNYKVYTPEKVSDVTGCPVSTFEKVAELYAESGAPGKAGTIMYAMGTTQHT
jgi:formate dehydrogenase major subunit